MAEREPEVDTVPVEGEAATGSAVAAGAVAGLIAGIVMAMVAMVRAGIAGEGFWMPIKQIAGTWLGVEALIQGAGAVVLGLVTHMAVSGAFGAIFGLFVGAKRAAAAFGGGILYGVVIWLVMTYAVVPVVNPTMNARIELIPVWWFVYHLIFGGMLFVGPYLAGEFAKSGGLSAWRPPGESAEQ